MRVPYGTTVTVLTRTRAGQDPDGNDVWTTVETAAHGCAVWPRYSTEMVQGRDTVIVGLGILAPYGTVLKATDQVRIGADVYEVEGEAVSLRSVFTGTAPGVQAALTRVTG